jgi:glycerol-3-phosphate acyltransferase PlsX
MGKELESKQLAVSRHTLNRLRLGVDLTGGDLAPDAILEAALSCLKPQELVVFAPEGFKVKVSGVEVVYAKETIQMDESPLLAVRRKKNSPLSLGMQVLKQKKIDAFLSAGNTGALVATASLRLKRIGPPSLAVLLPKENGSMVVLDVGANISFKPEHLVAYATQGILYKKALGCPKPRVALLNIGIEEQKGTKQIQEGFNLLVAHFKGHTEATFLGNVEAREVFSLDVDVLLTDGFTGNIFLKTCEGVSTFLMQYLKKKNLSKPLMQTMHSQFNYSEHPGAILLGVDGLVIKCHGYSDQTAWCSALEGAKKLVKANLMTKLRKAST